MTTREACDILQIIGTLYTKQTVIAAFRQQSKEASNGRGGFKDGIDMDRLVKAKETLLAYLVTKEEEPVDPPKEEEPVEPPPAPYSPIKTLMEQERIFRDLTKLYAEEKSEVGERSRYKTIEHLLKLNAILEKIQYSSLADKVTRVAYAARYANSNRSDLLLDVKALHIDYSRIATRVRLQMMRDIHEKLYELTEELHEFAIIVGNAMS
jgi:hypothetical protein